jgi:ribosomal protein L25 (general stress protein Ctc)
MDSKQNKLKISLSREDFEQIMAKLEQNERIWVNIGPMEAKKARFRDNYAGFLLRFVTDE